MKIYNISFDTVSITVVLDEDQDLFDFLLHSEDWNCDGFFIEDGKLHKKWSDSFSEECMITDLTNYRGIIHSEAH
jgi:hypothetical protein